MIKHFDIFMAFNGALLIGSTGYSFFTAELEFGLYALVILGLGALAWRIMRQFDYPLWMLLAMQIGVFAHFAGGFIYIDGSSLYWNDALGIRFDRIVHFYNSALASVVIASVYRQAGLALKTWEPWVVIMTVFGMGAAVEIVEYTATWVIPETTVGDQLNTMQDMAINFAGAAFGYILVRFVDARQSARAAGARR
jgi:uncharacterized membrane protein YjdF